MAFKKRKADRRKLDAPIFSGAAEVCETRALLSAEGVCVPAVDADAVVIEDIEATEFEEVIDVDATVEDGEFIPELAVCTMLPVIQGTVVEDLGGGDENEGVISTDEVVDPNLMFYSVMPLEDVEPEVAVCDDLVIEEPVFKGEVVEDLIVDGEEPVEVTAIEDFDPSWIRRSFGAPSGEVADDLAFTCGVVDGEVPEDVTDGGVKVQFWHDLAPGSEEDVVFDETDGNVDVTTLEDYDPSWAYRTLTAVVTDDGEEVVDDATDGEVKVQFWHDLAPGSEEDVVVDGTDGNVDVTTLEDFDPSWAYRGGIAEDGEPSDEVLEEAVVEDGEVTIDGEIVEKEVDEVDPEVVPKDGTVIPIRYSFGDNFRGNSGGEIPVEVLAMSSGAPAVDSTPSVMGPVAPSSPAVSPVVNIPVLVNQPSVIPTVVSPSLSIPVNQSGFSPLFGKEEELLITTLAPVVSEIEPLVSEVEDTVSSGLDSEFGDLIGSSSDSSDAPVGELTPIFEEEQNEEESVEVPAAEEAPIESEETVSSVVVPQQPAVVATRANYGRSIDEFMSEFAMSGFAG